MYRNKIIIAVTFILGFSSARLTYLLLKNKNKPNQEFFFHLVPQILCSWIEDNVDIRLDLINFIQKRAFSKLEKHFFSMENFKNPITVGKKSIENTNLLYVITSIKKLVPPSASSIDLDIYFSTTDARRILSKLMSAGDNLIVANAT